MTLKLVNWEEKDACSGASSIMKTAPATASRQAASPLSGPFQAGPVLTLAGGHLIHDTFTSFVAPLLPLIIAKLDLSLTLAGSLAALLQLPSLVNPFLGLLADRGSLRWLAILAPAVTAATMSLIGLAPTYTALAALLLVAGVSNATWHVPAPVMVARAAGQRVGRGMSFFMLGGELARTVGPLLAVGAVSWWGLEGTYRLIPLGVTASLVLYWRTRDVGSVSLGRADGSWAETWRELRRVLLPLTGIIFARGFMVVAMTTYLPTLLTSEGANLWQAGGALSILELAGAAGALTGGTVSDRLGRRRVLALVMLAAPMLMLLFLLVRGGWLIVPTLGLLGFIAFSTNPVLMALVQEYGRDHPATSNGLYMAIGFVGRSLIIVAVGAMADRWGLPTTFQLSAWLGFLGLLFVWLLPQRVVWQDIHREA
jgi:FSR family fosmidomycin resistance protein-like MFS transporter